MYPGPGSSHNLTRGKSPPNPTIVLVHGAWADASSWNAVASELQSQGFTVLAPPNLLRAAAIDAPYVASFIEQRTTGPVVLVGHSYGGFVITNAGTGGGDVRALVYVDAFLPDEGENVFAILGGSGSALDVPDPTTVLDIVGYPGAPEGDAELPEAGYGAHGLRAGPAGGRTVVDRGEPAADHPGCHTTPSGAPAWKSLPSWAVVGTEDRVIPPDTQRHMASRARATRRPRWPGPGCSTWVCTGGRHPSGSGRCVEHRRPESSTCSGRTVPRVRSATQHPTSSGRERAVRGRCAGAGLDGFRDREPAPDGVVVRRRADGSSG